MEIVFSVIRNCSIDRSEQMNGDKIIFVGGNRLADWVGFLLLDWFLN